MLRIIKRLPLGKTILAIIFLLIQTGSALYLPYLTAGIIDDGIMAGDIGYIWQQGLIMLIFAAISLVSALLNMLIAGKIAFEIGARLRDEIYAKALTFSKVEYDHYGTSGLINRNINDVTQVQNVVEMFLKFLILCPLYLICGIYLTWMLSPSLAIPFILVIPLMSVAAVIIYKFAAPLYSKMQHLLDKLNLLFREGITGVRVIRAFTKEEEDTKKYVYINKDYTKAAITAGTIISVFVPLVTLIINVTTLFIVFIGGNSVANGGMELGSIVAAVSYSAQILLGFTLLTNVILSLPRGQVSAKRINEVLDTSVTIENPTSPENPAETSLIFDDVSFRYKDANHQALSNISFEVKQGQTLAIIGGTGDGKSSLLSLIPRLYDSESGNVLLGNVNVQDMDLNKLRSIISYAPQKSSLIKGTIRSNMQLAFADASDEDIWSALDDACAGEFVSSLPDGLDSVVEKGGANFSGGQKQRLCIARTILKDADIYLFDDSFSALDFKTDSIVRANIHSRLEKKITVIVAQRIGTIANADVIAVLENGRLSGLGTHEELTENNSVYKEIVESQDYKEAIA